VLTPSSLRLFVRLDGEDVIQGLERRNRGAVDLSVGDVITNR
jgi:hypothetical protein